MSATSKIYFLINSLEWGWAERVVTNLTWQYTAKWYAVYVITLKEESFFAPIPHVSYIALAKVRHNFFLFLLIPRFVRKLRHLLRTKQLEEGISFLEIANFVHILAKKEAIISFRTHITFFSGCIWYIYKKCIQWLYPKAQKIIVNSLENKYDLSDYLRIPLEKIEVMYNTIDAHLIAKEREEPRENWVTQKINWKRVFITVGRLIPSKQHEKILAWLALLADAGKTDRIYLIVGDGPQRNYLTHLVKQYGIADHVIFLGEQKNVFKYLDCADYFLYASAVEWFPNVLAEAKSMGIPIITTDFKSWAKEVVLGTYDKSLAKSITYPYVGEAGILLDPNQFAKQFTERHMQL